MNDSTEVAVREAPAPSVVGARNADEWALVGRKAEALASSSIIPKDFLNKPANVLIAMDMAERTGMPVLAVMQNLHVVNGMPAFGAKFLIAQVNTSSRFSPLRWAFQGSEGSDEWGARAYATEYDTGEVLTGTLVTIKMAKAEGWYQKSGSKWQTMPEQMLQYRSATFWSRTYAPNLALGISTTDELEDVLASKGSRVRALAEAMDAPEDAEPIEAEVVEETAAEPDAPLVPDETAPTPGEVEKLRSLIDKLDLDFDDAETLEKLIADDDGEGVRRSIRDLQRNALAAAGDAEQGGLDV